tara:strand:- start:15376 stop:15813 length:438 start_codon:yes stop_codon:yes gene_type:complete
MTFDITSLRDTTTDHATTCIVQSVAVAQHDGTTVVELRTDRGALLSWVTPESHAGARRAFNTRLEQVASILDRANSLAADENAVTQQPDGSSRFEIQFEDQPEITVVIDRVNRNARNTQIGDLMPTSDTQLVPKYGTSVEVANCP